MPAGLYGEYRQGLSPGPDKGGIFDGMELGKEPSMKDRAAIDSVAKFADENGVDDEPTLNALMEKSLGRKPTLKDWGLLSTQKQGSIRDSFGRGSVNSGVVKKFGSPNELRLTRRVRTPAGARFYGAPIGSPIVKDKVTGKLKAVTKALDKATASTGGSLANVRERADSYPGEGSPKSPKRVSGDIEAAALLLSEGKSIRLESEMEVGTLIDKLAQTVEDAKKRGDKAPDYDLCKVSVPGTNLFCAQHKGIPRAKMPQFKGKDKDGKDLDVEEGWRKMLEDKGISVKRKTVPAAELKASQMQLDGPKVAGMSKAMEAGKIPDAPIFVTKDGYILDGHHRWAAKVAIDVKDGKLGDVNMPVDIIDIEIGEAIDLANAYTAARGIVPKGLGKDAEGVANPPKA